MLERRLAGDEDAVSDVSGTVSAAREADFFLGRGMEEKRDIATCLLIYPSPGMEQKHVPAATAFSGKVWPMPSGCVGPSALKSECLCRFDPVDPLDPLDPLDPHPSGYSRWENAVIAESFSGFLGALVEGGYGFGWHGGTPPMGIGKLLKTKGRHSGGEAAWECSRLCGGLNKKGSADS